MHQMTAYRSGFQTCNKTMPRTNWSIRYPSNSDETVRLKSEIPAAIFIAKMSPQDSKVNSSIFKVKDDSPKLLIPF
ncbi:unnamed protein product [Clonostachys byssicola]|uniref:Uncharacterized protein n=1 Tax=Clonostachys byssicola TaxID=160290 RepID=A0A9N9UD13_9HYPO|nr:unnamed protein product [Clonostachys byssicola]